MMYGGRFNRREPRYVGDNANNGVWRINEVYALKDAGLWPKSIDSYKDIYFASNKLVITSRSSTIKDSSILNVPLIVVKFYKDIIDGPGNIPVNAIYNDDYSNANGSYGYILTNNNTELIIGDQDYTIECWFKPIRRQPNGYYTLFSTYLNGSDGAVFGFDNDGRIFADGGFGNWAFGNIVGGINVLSGDWHHIAFSRSNGILRCFVNGSQYGSSANSTKIHTINNVRIGNYDNQSFIGYMTEIRFSVGVARYTSIFSVPVIPLPNIENEIAPLAPALSSDSLYGNQSIELFWRNVFDGGSDITSYDIAYSINSDMSAPTVENIIVSSPISNFTITGLINDTPYYCYIRANNAIGNGAYSNVIGPITPSASLPQRLIGGDPGIASGEYIGVSYKEDSYLSSTARANKIFDNNLTDNNENQWQSTGLNSAFGVDFGIEQTVLRYKMWRNTGNQNSPTNWILQGSNTQSDWDNLQNYNGTTTYGNWQTIDTRNNIYLPIVSSSSPADNSFGLFVVNSPASYRYYRLFVSGARADGPGTEASSAWIAEMQFLGIISTPTVPTNLSVSASNEAAFVSWSTIGPSITGYTIEWSANGGITVLGTANTSSQTYTVTGLTNGSSYVFRVKAINIVGESDFTSWSDAVIPAAGYTPIEDNIFRFIMDDNATTAIVSASTTTNYYKVISSTGQDSGVVQAGGNYGPWPYYWAYGTVSNMPTGQQKILQVISCDSFGNPSGELTYVSLKGSTQSVLIVDASGCTSLDGFAVPSNTADQSSTTSQSTLPSTIIEVRCIGVKGAYGFWSQWNQNYPPFVTQGINVAGQQLSAAALNQMYTDLDTSRFSGAIISVAGNPGTSTDDPSIATSKGYTVFGT